MAPSYWDEEEWDEEEEEYEAFGDQFDNDMDALKRACQLTGHADPVANVEEVPEYEDEDENEEDDSEFLQGIQNKLMLGSAHVQIPLIKSEPDFDHKPLESDVEEDDADILQAIRNRFANAGLPEKASTSYATSNLLSVYPIACKPDIPEICDLARAETSRDPSTLVKNG